jgi:predicted DNA binding CopG/RHH family protein
MVRDYLNKDVDVDALINKGAKVKEDIQKEDKKDKEWVVINVRISSEMLEAVDRDVKRKVGITRTGWILQAIDEKLTQN